MSDCACNCVCPLHEGYTQTWFMTTSRQPRFPRVLKVVWVTLQWLCPLFFLFVFFSSVSIIKSEQQALLWSHYGAWFHLPPLIDTSVILPQQEPVHALTIATIHLNQPEKKKKTSPVPLCSLAKCQESSAGCAPREEVDRQSSMFIPVSFKQPIHYSCSHWRFLQVSTGSQRNCV